MENKKPSLFNLTAEWDAIFTALIDDEVDENAAFEAIADIEGDIGDKADNYTAVITRLDSQVELLKAEEARCKTMRKVYENRSKRLKESLKFALEQTGQGKLTTDLHRYTLRNNPVTAKIVDIEIALKSATENGYIKPRVLREEDIDKAAVKEALNNGEYLEGFTLDRTTSLIIK